MSLFIKKIMALLALISVLSSSAWAFAPEVLFDDTVSSSVAVQDVHLMHAVQAHPHDVDDGMAGAEPFCNHACHISAHITAIEASGVVSTVPALDATVFCSEPTRPFTNPVLKSLYRPPACV